MIKREVIQQIKETATILDVVSDYVSLRRQGALYKGLCPFHNEKTPSFIVTPSKNLCKCFGCGKGGDPIAFIMEIEHISYPEALKKLGQKYGIEVVEKELTNEEKLALSHRERLSDATEWLQSIFVSNLDSDEGRIVGKGYFLQRGLTEATIKKFGLGYALTDRRHYSTLAAQQGYQQELIELGHISSGEYGISDFYAARAIFPIHSLSGKVIAFGGRGIRQQEIDSGKYKNSPENELYKKNQTLYGLCFAKNAMHKKEKAYISEGYLDVISMHQAGIENIVAPCGTALTEGQIRLLKRNLPSRGSSDSEEKFVTMLYDGDKAGMNAAIKNGKLMLSEGLNVSLVILPEGEDPDSFAQKNNADVIEKYLAENEQDYVVFRANLLKEEAGNDPLKRATAIKTIAEVVAVIPDAVKRVEYAKTCAKILDTENTIIHEYVGKERVKLAEAQAKEEAREYQKMQGYNPTMQITPQTPQTQFPQTQMPDATMQQQNAPLQVAINQNLTDKFAINSLEKDVYRNEREFIDFIIRTGCYKFIEIQEDDETKESKLLTFAEYLDYELKCELMELSHPVFKSMLYEVIKFIDVCENEEYSLYDYFDKHENRDFNEVAHSIEGDRLYLRNQMSESASVECEKKENTEIKGKLSTIIDYYKKSNFVEQQKSLSKELCNPANDVEKTTELMKRYDEVNEPLSKLLKKYNNYTNFGKSINVLIKEVEKSIGG